MGAPRQHIRREVRIGVKLPANHDKIAGEVAQPPPRKAAAKKRNKITRKQEGSLRRGLKQLVVLQQGGPVGGAPATRMRL